MARDHGRIHTAIWADPDFTALSAGAQLAYIRAVTQSGMTFCGVVPFTLRRWVNSNANLNADAIRRHLTELQAGRFVLVDEDTEELWVRSFVKNDGILDSPNLVKRMVSDLGSVMSPTIRAAFAWEWHSKLAGMLDADKMDKDDVRDALATLPSAPEHDPWEGLREPFGEGFDGASGRVSLARAAPTPAPTPTPTPSTDGADAPPATDASDNGKPPPHRELFETLADTCGLDTAKLTRNEGGRLGTAAKQLREIDATPGEVRAKAAQYIRKWPDMELTPTALVSNWSQLDAQPNGAMRGPPRCEKCGQPETDDHTAGMCRLARGLAP